EPLLHRRRRRRSLALAVKLSVSLFSIDLALGLALALPLPPATYPAAAAGASPAPAAAAAATLPATSHQPPAATARAGATATASAATTTASAATATTTTTATTTATTAATAAATRHPPPPQPLPTTPHTPQRPVPTQRPHRLPHTAANIDDDHARRQDSTPAAAPILARNPADPRPGASYLDRHRSAAGTGCTRAAALRAGSSDAATSAPAATPILVRSGGPAPTRSIHPTHLLNTPHRPLPTTSLPTTNTPTHHPPYPSVPRLRRLHAPPLGPPRVRRAVRPPRRNGGAGRDGVAGARQDRGDGAGAGSQLERHVPLPQPALPHQTLHPPQRPLPPCPHLHPPAPHPLHPTPPSRPPQPLLPPQFPHLPRPHPPRFPPLLLPRPPHRTATQRRSAAGCLRRGRDRGGASSGGGGGEGLRGRDGCGAAGDLVGDGRGGGAEHVHAGRPSPTAAADGLVVVVVIVLVYFFFLQFHFRRQRVRRCRGVCPAGQRGDDRLRRRLAGRHGVALPRAVGSVICVVVFGCWFGFGCCGGRCCGRRDGGFGVDDDGGSDGDGVQAARGRRWGCGRRCWSGWWWWGRGRRAGGGTVEDGRGADGRAEVIAGGLMV
ncbi:hypothetical protein DFJ73DRAFT_900894, partial [Zopfochytrium polystomum]